MENRQGPGIGAQKATNRLTDAGSIDLIWFEMIWLVTAMTEIEIILLFEWSTGGICKKKKKKKKGGRSNGQRNRALGIINRRSHRYRPVDIRWGQSKARNWRQQQKNSASPLLTRETGQYYRKIKNKKKGFHRAPRYGGRSDPRSRSWQFGIIPYCIVYCVLCMVWYGMVCFTIPVSLLTP